MQKNNIKFKHFVLFFIVTSHAQGPFKKIAQLKQPAKYGILAPPGARALKEARRQRELAKNLALLLREVKRTANAMQRRLAEIRAKNPNAELDEEQGGLPAKLPLVGLLAKGTYATALKACAEQNEDLFKQLIEAASWSQKVIFNKELKVKEALRRLKNIDEAISAKYSIAWLSDMSDKIIDPSVESSADEIDPETIESLYQYCKSIMEHMEEEYHRMLVDHAKELKMKAEEERLNDITLPPVYDEVQHTQEETAPEEEAAPEEGEEEIEAGKDEELNGNGETNPEEPEVEDDIEEVDAIESGEEVDESNTEPEEAQTRSEEEPEPQEGIEPKAEAHEILSEDIVQSKTEPEEANTEPEEANIKPDAEPETMIEPEADNEPKETEVADEPEEKPEPETSIEVEEVVFKPEEQVNEVTSPEGDALPAQEHGERSIIEPENREIKAQIEEVLLNTNTHDQAEEESDEPDSEKQVSTEFIEPKVADEPEEKPESQTEIETEHISPNLQTEPEEEKIEPTEEEVEDDIEEDEIESDEPNIEEESHFESNIKSEVKEEYDSEVSKNKLEVEADGDDKLSH